MKLHSLSSPFFSFGNDAQDWWREGGVEGQWYLQCKLLKRRTRHLNLGCLTSQVTLCPVMVCGFDHHCLALVVHHQLCFRIKNLYWDTQTWSEHPVGRNLGRLLHTWISVILTCEIQLISTLLNFIYLDSIRSGIKGVSQHLIYPVDSVIFALFLVSTIFWSSSVSGTVEGDQKIKETTKSWRFPSGNVKTQILHSSY